MGFVLPMSAGAILVSLSTAVVALNALIPGARTHPEASTRSVPERRK